MQELRCQTCNADFDSKDRLPLILPTCKHLLCSVCLNKLSKETKEDSIKCPQCGLNSQISVDSGTLSNCAVDEATLRTISDVRSAQGLEFDSYRKEQERLAGKQYQFCRIHGKPLDIVCRTDSTMICHECALFENHQKHDVIRVPDFQKFAKENLADASRQLDKLRKERFMDNFEADLRELRQVVNRRQTELKGAIEKQFDEAMSVLKLQKERCLGDLETAFNKLESEVGKLQLECCYVSKERVQFGQTLLKVGVVVSSGRGLDEILRNFYLKPNLFDELNALNAEASRLKLMESTSVLHRLEQMRLAGSLGGLGRYLEESFKVEEMFESPPATPTYRGPQRVSNSAVQASIQMIRKESFEKDKRSDQLKSCTELGATFRFQGTGSELRDKGQTEQTQYSKNSASKDKSFANTLGNKEKESRTRKQTIEIETHKNESMEISESKKSGLELSGELSQKSLLKDFVEVGEMDKEPMIERPILNKEKRKDSESRDSAIVEDGLLQTFQEKADRKNYETNLLETSGDHLQGETRPGVLETQNDESGLFDNKVTGKSFVFTDDVWKNKQSPAKSTLAGAKKVFRGRSMELQEPFNLTSPVNQIARQSETGQLSEGFNLSMIASKPNEFNSKLAPRPSQEAINKFKKSSFLNSSQLAGSQQFNRRQNVMGSLATEKVNVYAQNHQVSVDGTQFGPFSHGRPTVALTMTDFHPKTDDKHQLVSVYPRGSKISNKLTNQHEPMFTSNGPNRGGSTRLTTEALKNPRFIQAKPVDTEINLSGRNISDSKLINIVEEVIASKRIKVLNLNNNYITEIGVQRLLAKIANHNSLERILLANNYVGESVVDVIEPHVWSFKSINYFDFRESKCLKQKKACKERVMSWGKTGLRIDF